MPFDKPSLSTADSLDDTTERINIFTESYMVQLSDCSNEERIVAEKILIKVVTNIEISNLTTIDIGGSSSFRLHDMHVTFIVEAVQRSYIKLMHLRLKHHRITDLGLVQLCKLVLVYSFCLYPIHSTPPKEIFLVAR